MYLRSLNLSAFLIQFAEYYSLMQCLILVLLLGATSPLPSLIKLNFIDNITHGLVYSFISICH